MKAQLCWWRVTVYEPFTLKCVSHNRFHPQLLLSALARETPRTKTPLTQERSRFLVKWYLQYYLNEGAI